MGVFSSIGNFFSNAFGSAGRAISGGPAQTTSSSSSTGTSNSSSTRAPWEPVQSSIMDYIKNLPSVYNNPQISPYEQSGYDALSAGVDRSAGALDPAIAENNKTLSGYYLNPDTNPYIKQIADRMGGQAMAGANATFGTGGRTGSGIHQEQVGEGIANAVGNVYYGNYSDERGRMGSANWFAQRAVLGRQGRHPALGVERQELGLALRTFCEIHALQPVGRAGFCQRDM